MKARTTLYADEGMMLTDGDNFGRIVHLAVGADPKAWYEITEAEYEAILAAERKKEEMPT
jgi:hypothetical protein